MTSAPGTPVCRKAVAAARSAREGSQERLRHPDRPRRPGLAALAARRTGRPRVRRHACRPSRLAAPPPAMPPGHHPSASAHGDTRTRFRTARRAIFVVVSGSSGQPLRNATRLRGIRRSEAAGDGDGVRARVLRAGTASNVAIGRPAVTGSYGPAPPATPTVRPAGACPPARRGRAWTCEDFPGFPNRFDAPRRQTASTDRPLRCAVATGSGPGVPAAGAVRHGSLPRHGS